MKYDSVLDQQSISGKIVSLILCVWKPCYVKSGHNCQMEVPSISLTSMSSVTRGHSQRFRIPQARINSYLFSFLPSTIKLWNTLPEDVVNQPSINCFKDVLLNHLNLL